MAAAIAVAAGLAISALAGDRRGALVVVGGGETLPEIVARALEVAETVPLADPRH